MEYKIVLPPKIIYMLLLLFKFVVFEPNYNEVSKVVLTTSTENAI